MPTIHLTSFVAAPADRVFDLSRHIGLHQQSMKQHHEEAVAGTRFGLIEKEETVTWRARHLGKTRLLRVKITDMRKPEFFSDMQMQGDFKRMEHEHHFKPCDNGTIMIDLFTYEVPFGAIGKLFDRIYLNRYMTRLLQRRNEFIKKTAESDQWKPLLMK
jgi:ligand-binding SRPBCC domain-containing protein